MLVRRVWQRSIDMLEIILIVLAVLVALFLITFTIYWFNIDMKLVRKIYDARQK